MNVKKHPFLFGFLLVGLVIIVFYGLALLSFSVFSGKSFKSPGSLVGGSAIGVIEINGIIMDSKEIVNQIVDFTKDSDIKAILVRIDSPGGAVGPSQEIHRELVRAATSKKVIASLGGTAASGGYYIACAANKIMANEGTLTGSIGVRMDFVNVEGVYKWVGLKTSVIKSGKYKDIGSASREMTPEEHELLQSVIDDVYSQFVDAVAQGRNMKREDVVPFADGRIFTGRQAQKNGFVDEIGNFRDAVKLAATLVNIKGEPELVYPPKKHGMELFRMFFDEALSKAVQGLVEQEDGKLYYKY